MPYRKLYLILSAFLFPMFALGQIDFTYSSSTGSFCAGGTITFTAQSSGTSVEYFWNFGNGQLGTGQSSNANFTAGTYNVTLTAIFPDHPEVITKILTINPQPTVSITTDKTSLCKPDNIIFAANATGASINSYEWNFGDANTTITNNNQTNHLYSTYGNYNATVVAISPFGCKATASTAISLQKINLSGGVIPSKGCIPANSNLSYTASLLPGDAIQSSTWDFGDGSPSITNNSNSINHTYNTTNNITTASVMVTTANGCTNNINFPSFAFGTPPPSINAGTASGNSEFCASETVLFTANAPTANSFSWFFENSTDSTIATSNTSSHKYNTLGDKQIIVNSFFNGCKGASDTFTIKIKGVIASYSESNTCSGKNTISFNNTSQGNITNFSWTYSDIPQSPNSTVFSPTHSFPALGTYNTLLFLSDTVSGCIDTLRKPFFFYNPVAHAGNNRVCKDSAIIYWVTNPYPTSANFTYHYYINNQHISGVNMDTLVFNPSNFGTYPQWIVIDNNNSGLCNDTLNIGYTTTVGGPIPDFNFNGPTCQNKLTNFTNLSAPYSAADSIVKYVWNFGYGSSLTINNPLPQQFPGSGTYQVSLTATDIHGCVQKVTKPVVILPIAGIYAFPPVDSICVGQSLDIQAYSAEPITWTPNYNIQCLNCDSTVVSPTITTYYVAHNINSYGCANTDTVKITVYNPFNLKVTPADTSVCPNIPVRFSSNVPEYMIKWTPANYLNSDTSHNPIAISNTAGTTTYQVMAHDPLNCFSDTTEVRFRVYEPAVANGLPDIIVNYMEPFTLQPSYSTNISSYSWSPSSPLNCANCPYPTGMIKESTVFTVTGSTGNGCMDTAKIKVIVNCDGQLFLPNAFTPNNDGINDYFYPLSRGVSDITYFVVYDRLGNKVFERKNFVPNSPQLGWNGTYKGTDRFNTQTFVYYIEANCEAANKKLRQKGTVVLIR